jgi:protein-tyrosine phosphatase
MPNDPLGVPKADILKDYLLSNLYNLPSYRGEIEKFRMAYGEAVAVIVTMRVEVRSEYLQAAYQVIDDLYGSLYDYWHVGLGLEDKDIARLKRYLLI